MFCRFNQVNNLQLLKTSFSLIRNLRFEGDLPIILNTGKVPIHLFTKEIDHEAFEQLVQLSKSDIPYGFIAGMPDVHVGVGATVGSVFASKDKVVPNAVGVDIGCGMTAIPFPSLYKNQLSQGQLIELQNQIKNIVPSEIHQSHVNEADKIIKSICDKHLPSRWLESEVNQNRKVLKQIGTLGGGNHFIEVLYEAEVPEELISDVTNVNSSGRVWVMLHSGSRNIGNVTAIHHNYCAQNQMKESGITPPKSRLNFLEINSKEGKEYLSDMEWCQQYAWYNRDVMLRRVCQIVTQATGKQPDYDSIVNIHHNYCQHESCRLIDHETGKETDTKLWVTRKGATSAKEGEIGIIPGSMGTGSYIVKGKGNIFSFQSCSHGAGRKLSRSQAMSAIDQSDFVDALKGIVCDKNPSLRDEAPQAYKNLESVMVNQISCVDVIYRLLPLVNVKGF